MSKELLTAAKAVSNAKLLPSEKIFEALEQALATSTKKRLVLGTDIRIDLDQKTGLFRTFRRWQVVEVVEHPVREITYEAAIIDEPDVKIGDFIEDEIESIPLDRVALQTVRQVIAIKIREAEKNKEVEQFEKFLGTILNVIVKKITHNYITVALSNEVTGIIYKQDWLKGDSFRVGDHIRALLGKIKPNNKDSQFILTRTDPLMLSKLFTIEVPEIAEEVIEIKAIARDPGIRSKIAVKSNDKRIDPIGACIGMRGSRIQTIIDELSGERIDVVLWSDDKKDFVANAMSPAKIEKIIINVNKFEKNKDKAVTADIAVLPENLAQAIGKDGQNIRLATQLTGMVLNVMTVAELEEKIMQQSSLAEKTFKDSLGINDWLCRFFLSKNIHTIEEVASLNYKDLDPRSIRKSEFDAIQSKAKLVLEQINEENKKLITEDKFDQRILNLAGITEDLAVELALAGIHDLEQLADCSVDEINNLKGMDTELAGQLIIGARNICWFNE